MIPTFAQTSLYSAVLGLFSSGANGVLLDANDWGPTGTNGVDVLYQDASGTTPVTAVEQPVGLVLDKSQNLALGSNVVTNGDFSNGTTGWSSLSSATLAVVSGELQVTSTGVSDPGATQTLTCVVGKPYKITLTGRRGTCVNGVTVSIQSVASSVFNNTTSSAQGTLYFFATSTSHTLRIYIKSTAAVGETAYFDNISCKQIAGNHAYAPASANRPTISARYNLLLATATLSTQSVTVGAGSYTLYFAGSGSVALSGAATGTKTAGSNVITCTAGTLTLTVTGSVLTADLRPTDQATGLIPTYQRVNTATDYDTVGFPIREAYNGSNQYLTGASGGGATTGFFFCAGVMITKVGAAQTLFSDTGANTGWRVRINASNQLELSAGNGTAYTTIATAGTVSVNKLTVVTAWHDGTNLNVQINQGAVAQVAFAVATAGTAGYSLGVDNGASTNYLQGSLGEIVYRTGTAMTAAQIASTQAFVNSKQKAY